MRFRHSRNGVFAIGPTALTTFVSFVQHAPDALEAGGVLLGRYLRDGRDIIVNRVSVPKPEDVRTRFGFTRTSHQDEVDEAWTTSGGTCCYLGDWHTHAEPFPSPSPLDLANWHRMLREEILDDEACFFVIVGQLELRVWEGNRAARTIDRLVIPA